MTHMYIYDTYIRVCVCVCEGFPGDSVVKNLPAKARDTGDLGSILGQEDPLEKQPTSVFLPGKSHGL